MPIGDEIKQPVFKNFAEKTHINILYTASWLNQLDGRILKPYGVSPQQFNILRILRGLRGKPATVKLLTSRMVDKMSNTSRLVDKLVEKHLAERVQCKEDRRRVDITITNKGLLLVEAATQAMDTYIQDSFQKITEAEAEQLNNLLDKLRL